MSHMLFQLQLQQNGLRNSPHSFSQYQKISFIWCMKFHGKHELWRLCRAKGRGGLWNPEGVTREPAQPAPVRAISCPRTPAWVVSPRHVTSSGNAWRSPSPRDTRGHGAVPRGWCGLPAGQHTRRSAALAQPGRWSRSGSVPQIPVCQKTRVCRAVSCLSTSL